MHFRTATFHSTAPSAIAHTTLAAAGLTLIIFLLTIMSTAARADPTQPPSRVGRVGLVEGDVSFFADREEGWRKARLNFPVTSKNSIWTNGPSRAEVRVGASAVRLDADTMLDFVTVDDVQTNLYLQRGNVNIRVRGYAARPSADDTYRDQFRIETNSGTWTLEQNGRYRLEVMQDRNETRISVYAGQARFDNGSAQLRIETGKSLRVGASSGAASFTFDKATEIGFDRWAENRDLRWDETHLRYASERIVSPYMTGYEELDSHGDWIDEPDYGRLWTPRIVASGWAPYRYGAWSYVRPWGWTWIDEAPWGFAPFHYGRWVQIRTRWYWAPGRYHHRPVYAPALVGWYGDGNTRLSISVGAPIGWFPLAPREHFIPTYTTSTTYIRNINVITNNTIITAPTQYQNQGVGGTLVNQNVVVHGEPVWRSARISGGPTSRMVKPARDPQVGSPDIAPRWIPTAPPPAPTQTGQPILQRPTAIAGEAPVAHRPTWVAGEVRRPQSGVQPIQQPNQPASISTPGAPVAPLAPASPSSLHVTPTPSTAGESATPIARPKPNPRPAASADTVSPSPNAPLAERALPTPSSMGYSVTTIPSLETQLNLRNERGEREARSESRGAETRAPRTEGPQVNPPRLETNRTAPVQIQSPVTAVGKPKQPREDKPSARTSSAEGRAPQADTKAAQPRTEERMPRVSQQ